MTEPSSVIVVDLDGTLCNSMHRDHLAVAGQWDDFHSRLVDDQPWPDVKQLLDIFYPTDITVVGLTGRNERYRWATLKWLTAHNVWLDDLLMRPDDNYQSDQELKPAMLAKFYKAEQVWFILEDREKVVEAWRNLGLNCWQVRPGGY